MLRKNKVMPLKPFIFTNIRYYDQNLFFCCFSQREVLATRCFLPDQKMLFLAKVIEF